MTAMPPPPSSPPPAMPPPMGSTGGSQLATWGQRFLAYLIDALIVAVPTIIVFIIGIVLVASTADTATGDLGAGGGIGILLYLLAAVAGTVFQFWNVGWRQGETGQSIGKSRIGIAVIRKDGSGYLGGGMGIVRAILHSIFGACFLNYLWPLWDDQNQTWTDMVLDTLVVQA